MAEIIVTRKAATAKRFFLRVQGKCRAVDRNLVKRRVRAVLRDDAASASAGEYRVIVRMSAGKDVPSFSDLRAMLKKSFARFLHA